MDDGSLTLVRTVLAGGRSRAAAGGAAVPVGTLAELGAAVAAIHGQSEQVHLVAPSRQRDLLDRYGALLPARDAVAADHAELSRLRREWDDLQSHRQQRTAGGGAASARTGRDRRGGSPIRARTSPCGRRRSAWPMRSS